MSRIFYLATVKEKFNLEQAMKGHRGEAEVYPYAFFNLSAR
jgi:hypothetical protein